MQRWLVHFPLVLALLFAVSQSFGIGAVPTATTTAVLWTCTSNDGSGTGQGITPTAACNQAASAYQSFRNANTQTNNTDTVTSCATQSAHAATCSIHEVSTIRINGNPNGNTTETWNVSGTDQTVPSSCEPGSTASGAVCICNVGTKPDPNNASNCIPYTCPTRAVGSFNVVTSTDPGAATFFKPQYTCDALNVGARKETYGCSETLQPAMTSHTPGTSTWVTWFDAGFNGQPCNGDGTTAPATAASGVPSTSDPLNPASATSCSMGTCPGTVNGLAVCQACTSTTGAQASQTSASAAAGVLPGTVTTTQCDGKECVTTTATTSGGVTVTSTSVGNEGTYCASNSGDPQCVAAGLGLNLTAGTGAASGAASGSSGTGSGGGGGGPSDAFGGACNVGTTGGSFACTGDAVECAVAQEQHVRDCENAFIDPAIQATFTAAQGDGAASSPNDSTMSVASLLPAPPTGACSVTDDSISVGSGVYAFTYVMPWSSLMCDKLAAIRVVVVSFGALIFALIVFGGRRT